MYFEYDTKDDVLGDDIKTESVAVNLLDSLPIIELPLNKHHKNDFRKDRDMNINKEYSTYHSENNCRDWMLTD